MSPCAAAVQICPAALAADNPKRRLLQLQPVAQMEKLWTSLGSDVQGTKLLSAQFRVIYLCVIRKLNTVAIL